jgi:uncharacterized protein involved in cysteine biosynthesis
MHRQFNLSEFFPQCIKLLHTLAESYDFFKKHKLWKGIFEHKWILLLTVILSCLFTFSLFSNLYEYFFQTSNAAELGIIDVKSIASESAQNNKDTAIFGGSKFLLLIMLEIVIFHFSVRTLEILNNEKYNPTFGMFLKAEVRMIKVLIRGFFYSLIAQIILTLTLSLIGMKFIFPFLLFIVHSYFIGYAFFDNYNEQQKLNIKESDLLIRHHSGAATSLGVIASIGLLIPLLGALVVPVFAAITANLYGFKYNIDQPKTDKIVSETIEEIV